MKIRKSQQKYTYKRPVNQSMDTWLFRVCRYPPLKAVLTTSRATKRAEMEPDASPAADEWGMR